MDLTRLKFYITQVQNRLFRSGTIYMNGQRELIKELFNFFVAMTKQSHLCHFLIASADGYFIEKVYNDSKLRPGSKQGYTFWIASTFQKRTKLINIKRLYIAPVLKCYVKVLP